MRLLAAVLQPFTLGEFTVGAENTVGFVPRVSTDGRPAAEPQDLTRFNYYGDGIGGEDKVLSPVACAVCVRHEGTVQAAGETLAEIFATRRRPWEAGHARADSYLSWLLS